MALTIKKGNIGNALKSIAPDQVVATADNIYDDQYNNGAGEYQHTINAAVANHISSQETHNTNVDTFMDNIVASNAFYECSTAGNTAAKVINDETFDYMPISGGSMKIQFTNKNTASNATLNINNTGAMPLYYAGERASSSNTWEAGEVVEVYYNDNAYYANNVAGGSGDGVFDISEYNKSGSPLAPTQYADLAAALGPSGANVPENVRAGGMSVKFINSASGKYEQCRLMAASWSTTVTDWQDVDDTPTAGSQNLVTSGGVNNSEQYIKNTKLDYNILHNGYVSTDGTLDLSQTGYKYTDMIPEGIGTWMIGAELYRKMCFSAPYFNSESYLGYASTNNPVEGTKYVSYVLRDSDNTGGYDNFCIIRNDELRDYINETCFDVYKGFFLNDDVSYTKSQFEELINGIKYATKSLYLYGSSVDLTKSYYFKIVSISSSGFRIILKENTTTIIDSTLTIPDNKIIDTTITSENYNLRIIVDVTDFPSYSNTFTYGFFLLNSRAFSLVEKNAEDKINEIVSDVEDIADDIDALDNRYDTLTEEETVYSDNLFDKDSVEVGSLKTADGTVKASNDSYRTSDYIPVEVGSSYKASNNFRYACFYDSAKTYLGSSSAVTSSDDDFIVPQTASYVRICITLVNQPNVLDTYTLAKGTQPIPYVPYKTEKLYVKPTALPVVEIILPDVIETFPNDHLQLFWRSIIKASSNINYSIEATLNGIKVKDCLPRYLSISPSASETGDKILTVFLRDNFGNIMASKSCVIRVTALPSSSPSSNKNILLVGASIVAKGYIGYEVNRRLTTTTGNEGATIFPKGLGLTNISFVGRIEGQYTNIHQEATGGRKWLDYTTEPTHYYRFYCTSVEGVERGMIFTNNGISFTIAEINQTENTLLGQYNGTGTPDASGTLTLSTDNSFTVTYTSCDYESANPFWDITNSKDSFTKYCTDNNISGGIDYIVPWMGSNDLYAGRSIADIKSSIEQFIDWFHADYPSAKVILPELHFTSYFGGYGTANQVSTFYNRTKQITDYNVMIQEIASSSVYSGFVIVCGTACQFDCEYGYTLQATDVNNRVNDYKDNYAIDEIHPRAPYLYPSNSSYESTINTAPNGYYLLADALFRTLCKLLA